MTKTLITINNNEPVHLETDFEIVNKDGEIYDLRGKEIVSLCRCAFRRKTFLPCVAY